MTSNTQDSTSDSSDSPKLSPVSSLHKQSEALLQNNISDTLIDINSPSPEAVRQMLHELAVHQIKLEMQNEELRRIQLELEDSSVESISSRIRKTLVCLGLLFKETVRQPANMEVQVLV
jgi:hypothetical protein